ncbi:hypothetical protein SLEP1_g3171 [Rubroshorea leprosula]|uniref:Uncharacterized protein n=1 Tax=Rubroshorea leprosula TaxID=152421 RepID=A0AAV5HRW5_9ROSI|nr:hypothetical protein SLEP1_g3171 [Rubroshorea leprosula]
MRGAPRQQKREIVLPKRSRAPNRPKSQPPASVVHQQKKRTPTRNTRKSVHQQKGEHPPRSVRERSNATDSLCSSQPALLGRTAAQVWLVLHWTGVVDS